MRRFLMTIAITFCAAGAGATSVGETFVIPIAGHVAGANGQTWMTDLMIHNPGDSTIVVEVAGVDANGEAMATTPTSVTVGAGQTAALHDVVRPGGIGALLVAGSAAFTLTSRVYTETPRGATGAEVTPVSRFLDIDSGDGFLPGLVANARQRTNIGWFAVAGTTPLQIEIALLDATGASLGSRTFEVPAGRLSHLQLSSRDIVPVAFDAATARVRVTGGDGVMTAYASVVDNGSSDGSFIAAASGPSALLQSLPRAVMMRIRGGVDEK